MIFDQFQDKFLNNATEGQRVDVLVGPSPGAISQLFKTADSLDGRRRIASEFTEWLIKEVPAGSGVWVEPLRDGLASVRIWGSSSALASAFQKLETSARNHRVRLDYCPAEATVVHHNDGIDIQY